MAHLGLSLAPIGQGKYRNAPRPTNNNNDEYEENVWEVDLNDLTPPPVGNNNQGIYTKNQLNWARNRRKEYMTPKPTRNNQRNVPNAPKKAPRPPSTPIQSRKRKLSNLPVAPKKKVKQSFRRQTRRRRA